MNRKKRLCSVLLVAAVCLVLALSVSASAGTVTKELSYNDIKIRLDGEELIPVDAAGNYVEPFIIDGTTYLPVRGIASALGLEVGWDGATKTVLLTTPETSPEPDLQSVPEPAPEPGAQPVPEPEPAPERGGLIHGVPADTIVYVSTRSHTIHSVHDCSGMKNYSEMTVAEAEAKGYDYCPNCW